MKTMNRRKIMKNKLMMKWMAIAVAALAGLPCLAADKPDAAKAGGGRADVAQEVLALTGSRTKIVWARRVAKRCPTRIQQPG